jgi:hypothetical protein
MASGLEITCANKNNQGVIVRIGGPGWSLSTHEAIMNLLNKEICLHLYIGNASFDIGVQGEGNNAYLILEPDGTPLHQLDQLQSCES